VRCELDLPADSRLLLYAGRLAREKNVRVLIDMMDLLAEDGREHLLIVGDGELRRTVMDAAERRDDMTWMPYCDTADRLADLYSAADLFVHAGTSETFGLGLLESQACGTPAVAVHGGGGDETLRGESRPLSARNADPRAMAAAVREGLGRPEDETTRRARAERTARRFSTGETFRKLSNLYLELYHGNRAPRAAAESEVNDVLPDSVLRAG
jgi:alpha-1,6-mannosyltransferase